MLYATHESNRPASDHTVIAHDLKTFKGIANRIVRGYWPSGVWAVYACANDGRGGFYAPQSEHKRLGTVTKG